MKIHEFQAKKLLRAAGVTVLENQVCSTATDVAGAFQTLGCDVAVVKAQIHAGGRGKGTLKENPDQHGVQLVRSVEEATEVADQLLGSHLVTLQTGQAGQKVRQVLVEVGCAIARELYLGIVVDRNFDAECGAVHAATLSAFRAAGLCLSGNQSAGRDRRW